MMKYVLLAIACIASLPGARLSHATEGGTYFDDCASRTGSNATIIITSTAAPTLGGEPLPAGVEVAVFNREGLCGGVGTWDGTSLIITVWGNDSQTDEKDGLDEEEQFEYRLWDPASETEINASNAVIEVTYDTSYAALPGTSGGFADGAIFQVGSFEVLLEDGPTNLVDRMTLHPNYPNPASNETTFEFDLPKRSIVKAEVFDLLGRLVAVIKPEGSLLAGRHSIQVELHSMPSGTYVLRLIAGDSARTRAFKVVR